MPHLTAGSKAKTVSRRQLFTGYKAAVTPKIISGGQTGADRAALDWAIFRGIPHSW